MSLWERGRCSPPARAPLALLHPNVFPLGGGHGLLCLDFLDKQTVAARGEPGGLVN